MQMRNAEFINAESEIFEIVKGCTASERAELLIASYLSADVADRSLPERFWQWFCGPDNRSEKDRALIRQCDRLWEQALETGM